MTGAPGWTVEANKAVRWRRCRIGEPDVPTAPAKVRFWAQRRVVPSIGRNQSNPDLFDYGSDATWHPAQSDLKPAARLRSKGPLFLHSAGRSRTSVGKAVFELQ
jgi:hypothetical protein